MNTVPVTNPTETLALELRAVMVTAMRGPNVVVAQNVNWAVREGEFWILAAPQNTGKTDFMMTLGGITSPAAGEFRFFGTTMPIFEEARLTERLRLGLVFDGGQLLNALTITENIALPLRYHTNLSQAQIDARVNELLKTTELTPWAHNTPVNVPRAWQQRAGLARALAMQPDVLLLDSPLSGLDPRHTYWWLKFLDELMRESATKNGKKLTLIVSGDDLRPWRRHANRVACLHQQQLLVLGDWTNVAASEESIVKELLREEVVPRQRI